MNEFHFFTTWDFEAPIETVWTVISDPLNYPSWWKYVDRVTLMEEPEADGTGGLMFYTWKTALPYKLSFEMRGTGYHPPHLYEGTAKGELNGVGRWELQEMDGFTRVTYDWRIGLAKAWLNLLTPLARPAFGWNHNTIMDEGARALAARLGVRLLDYKNETLN